MVSVNGVSVSGLSQQQVVTLLRNTPTHSTVTIVVERPQTAAVQTVSAVHNRTQVCFALFIVIQYSVLIFPTLFIISFLFFVAS